jgi:hypothetical protein
MRWPSIIAFCIGFLTIGVAGNAGAATLDFTRTLSLHIAPPFLPPLVAAGGGSGSVTDDGSFHLLSFTLPGGAFGPTTVVVPLMSSTFTGTALTELRLTLAQNLSGSFSGISGGPPGGGPMGLSGIAKICLNFGGPGCISNIPFPLTPTGGGAGFGIGGTATFPGPVALTMFDAPWTIGQPAMTIHTPNSTITTPVLPGGFAHGPASLTSSTAQTSGVVQLVTASKVYTSLTSAFPEMPVAGILTLHFAPEPGTLLLLFSGAVPFAFLTWRRRNR